RRKKFKSFAPRSNLLAKLRDVRRVMQQHPPSIQKDFFEIRPIKPNPIQLSALVLKVYLEDLKPAVAALGNTIDHCRDEVRLLAVPALSNRRESRTMNRPFRRIVK